jgi:hypothetical protein
VACLSFSHDLLGFTSPLADNISGNFFGIGLGTLFRFWAYRRFVFTELSQTENERPSDQERGQTPVTEEP